MWRETTKHERNRRIFEEEIDPFLPERVFDCHVHLLPRGVVPQGETFSAGGHAIDRYEASDLARDLAELYPGRRIGALCFGFPDRSYDFHRSNEGVADSAAAEPRFPCLRLADPAESDRAAARRDLSDGRFHGIKPYHCYVRDKETDEVTINDMLPDWLMEVVDALGHVVMLHIPRRGRLADPVNRRQLVEICERWPRARFVLAHIGRAYWLSAVAGQLDALRDISNLWFDTAMVTNWEVLEHAFATLRPDRVLFGTDMPIALAPGCAVEINHQYAYVTPAPWELSICDADGRIRFTSFAYEQVRAIRKATERLGLGRSFIEGLFAGNAGDLLQTNLFGD